MGEEKAVRLTFIDLARTYAVFLALLAHLLINMGPSHRLGQEAVVLRQLARMATPLFVFMFGFMIEFVYVARVKSRGYGPVCRRILIRSVQCYVAFVVTGYCAVLGGYISPARFIDSLVFLSDSRFGNIMRGYSVMLLITPLIIWVRIRFGIRSILLLLAALVISGVWVHHFKFVDFGMWNHPLNVLLGIGIHRGGPSVYGAFCFSLAGMAVASSLTSSGPNRSATGPAFYGMSLQLLVICLMLGYGFIGEGVGTACVLFARGVYRTGNAPGYYIIGIIISVLTLVLFRAAAGLMRPAGPIRWILPMGVSSLVSFTAGNMILNLWGRNLRSLDFYLAAPLFFAVLILIVTYMDKIPAYGFVNDLMNFRCKEALQRGKAWGHLLVRLAAGKGNLSGNAMDRDAG